MVVSAVLSAIDVLIDDRCGGHTAKTIEDIHETGTTTPLQLSARSWRAPHAIRI
jgi:hypothetical protein